MLGKEVAVGDLIFFARKEGRSSVRRYLARVSSLTPKYLRVQFPPVKSDGWHQDFPEEVLVKSEFVIVEEA